MKLAILGAAGKVGGLTVLETIRAGHHAVALARRTARIPDAAGPGALTRVQGDVLDANSLDRAIRGTDAVICVFGAPLNWSTITRQPALCEHATRLVLASMRDHGVQRLICLTAIGVGDSRDRGRPIFRSFIRPVVLGRIFADRERQEALVRASGARWTIVRPAELTDAPPGPWRAVDASDRTLPEPSRVPRATVARFLVHEAEQSEFVGRAPILTASSTRRSS